MEVVGPLHIQHSWNHFRDDVQGLEGRYLEGPALDVELHDYIFHWGFIVSYRLENKEFFRLHELHPPVDELNLV